MDLKQLNAQRWANCSVPADKGPMFAKVAERIRANKEVYDRIEKTTGVPWWFVGIVHYRESNLDMSTNLAQGDPWNKKSIHVPKGRGPFTSFEEAAVDALTNCAPFAAKNIDWTPGGALTMFEKYNGLGYANKGIPSPYVWAGTNQYVSGKYVADGVFDANAVDKQLGCAGLVKFLGVYKANAPVAAGTVAAGTIVATAAATSASAPMHYIPYIIGGGIFLALLAFLWIDLKSYRRSKETAVDGPVGLPPLKGNENA